MGEVEQVVRTFINDNFLFGQAGSFSDTDSFLDNGLIDSMGILTLVEFVSEQYQISVADEEILPENWDSVARIASFVESKLHAIVREGGADGRLISRVVED